MYVHPYHSIEANHRQQIGNYSDADGFASARPSVLSSVAEVWNNGAEFTGAGASGSVREQKQFQQILCNRSARWLEQVDVPPSHALVQLNTQFTIREPLQVALPK
jgi:hypothetical protein